MYANLRVSIKNYKDIPEVRVRVLQYEACAMGFQAAIEKGVKELEVYGNSTLIIYQLRGEWKTRDSCLLLYHKI